MAADNSNKPVRKIQFGYALPGAVTWGIAVVTVLCMVMFPHAWLYVTIAFLAYFLLKMSFTLVFSIVGEVRMRRWAKRDFTQDYDAVGPFGFAPGDVHHVVIVPSYKEPIEILRRTIDALARQYRADERMIVILGMEEREQGCEAKAAALCAEYAGRLEHITYAVHPVGLPDEVAGKSSNEAWAARSITGIVEDLGLDPDLVTVSSCDADSVFHDRYFAAVAQLFSHDEKRHNRFWQAPLFFYNNIWQVPAPVRLSTWFAQSVQISELSCPGFSALPISTYTLSMPLAMRSGWWDPAVIPEDWHTFLTAQFAHDGDVSIQPILLPTYGDATDGETWTEGMKSRNLQLMRHAWGAEDVGWIFDQLVARREARKPFAIFRFLQVTHDHVIRTVSWLLLTSAWILSVWLGHQRAPGLHFVPYSQQLTLLSWGLALGGGLMIATIAIDIIRMPPPEHIPLWKVAVELAVLWFTLPLTGFYLGAGPAFSAQTKLMLGIPIGYRVTPKRLAQPAEQQA